MSSSSLSAYNGESGDGDDDGHMALNQVRQALAERRGSRGCVGAGAVNPAAAASASASSPLLGKPREETSPEPILFVDHRDHENHDDGQHRHVPGFRVQHRARLAPTAPDASLSCGEDGKSLSVSPTTSPRASKSSATVGRALPPPSSPRRISHCRGFPAHTLNVHDLSAAVLAQSSHADALPPSTSTLRTANELSAAATDDSGAHSRHRKRAAINRRPSVVFDMALAEAMVSTVEHMRENQQRRGSAAQPWRRHSLMSNATSGIATVSCHSDASAPASAAALRGNRRSGPPTMPLTSRAMALLGHTTADVLTVADDGDSVGYPRATARGWPQQHGPITDDLDTYADDVRGSSMAVLLQPASSSAPLRATVSRDKKHVAAARNPDTVSGKSSVSPTVSSFSWGIAGRPVSHDWVRGLSTAASGRSGTTAMAVSSGTADVAVSGVPAKDPSPHLSYHQLTEAFYRTYKGGEMAQGAYLYFVAQQRQQQQQPRGDCDGTNSRHGSKHRRLRPSAATTTLTRAGANTRGGYAVQQAFVSRQAERQPTATSEASTTAAAHAVPTPLGLRSTFTDTRTPTWRRDDDAAAEAQETVKQHQAW